jgi:hypothetical protein
MIMDVFNLLTGRQLFKQNCLVFYIGDKKLYSFLASNF